MTSVQRVLIGQVYFSCKTGSHLQQGVVETLWSLPEQCCCQHPDNITGCSAWHVLPLVRALV